MATSSANLTTTDYVKVNSTLNPIVLQAHSDAVRIVISGVQPARGNAVFHILHGGSDPLHLGSLDTDVWALATSDESSLIVTELDQDRVSVHDGYDIPIKSLKGALAVYDADVHNVIVNRYLHQHVDAVETTLTADTSGDGTVYQIPIADATGFALGDYLHVNTTSTETTHPAIVASAPALPTTGPAVFTLDRRLDKAHLAGDLITKAIVNMASQAGSLTTPQEYYIEPTVDEVWYLYRILFVMTHDTGGDLGKFGGITALTNGVLIRAKINGQYGTLTNWKINSDMKVDMFDVEFDSRSGGQGSFGTSGRGTFKNTGASLRLDGASGDRLEVYVQDDITLLNTFTMKAQGHLEDQ
jgi:hypothetical protein